MTLPKRNLWNGLRKAPGQFSWRKGYKGRRKDGLKLYLDDSNWLLIRPSGTEPLIRLYYEGTSEETINKVAKDFNNQVDQIIKDLEKKDSNKNEKVGAGA